VVARARSVVDATTLDRLILIGLLVLATVLRFVDLPTRGTWDADQGNDMLVLHGLVLDGRIPLLGPPTSIGDFHHGVLYYYLLAPAAALTGADPLGVVAAIALAGVAAVGVTWWLARSIAGSVAGAVAGLLMAVSTSAVDESTFIWNPNLIALSSSIALAGAWRAWTSGRPRWWLVAAAGAIVTMHCHVLGSVLLPPIVALLVADVRRQRGGPGRTARLQVVLVAAAMLAVSYVPLAIHEVSGDFSETRAALAFFTSGEGSGTSLPVRLLIVALRVLSWPLTGLLTDAPVAGLLAAVLVVGIASWRSVAAAGAERTAARWFGLTLVWSVLALTIGASGLATVISGLPNDHYHAFVDPIVFVLVGMGAAALSRWRPTGGPAVVGPVAAVGLVAVLTLFNLANQPPRVHADGGWPAARAAADRVLTATGPERPIVLDSLPTFKPPHAVRFPLVVAGADVSVTAGDGDGAGGPIAARVVLCDDLFRDVIGKACGGPAEDATVTGLAVEPVERFEAAPGRWISVYLPG
jgi:4-amino-4-deoxy-L-arabinose transferase-like glycosyltransferase